MERVLLLLCLVVLSGCAGAVDEQIQKLRADIAAESKLTEEAIRKDHSRDLTAAQEALRTDYERKLQELKKELGAQKEQHEKDLKDVNVTLIDVQKDSFKNRRVTEENARRVYILESLFASREPAHEERAEGTILLFKEGNVTTSLGTKHGVKAGDVLAVFKDESSREKLATVRVMVAEADESRGELVEKSAQVTRGYFVRPVK